MKKSFFPVLIAAVALLFSSCIKNVESDGVKAVRMGQAALLTAQAAATTTEANANAALTTAMAAYQATLGAVNTAEAAAIAVQAANEKLMNDARVAREVANTAEKTEQIRHQTAVNKINEDVATAQGALDKQVAVNSLARENAENLVNLAQLANAKAMAEYQAAFNVANNAYNLANQKILNEQNLIAAQTALDAAKLAAAQAAAAAKIADEMFIANLKEQKLTDLAGEYNAAVANYNVTQGAINDLKNNVIANTQLIAALNASFTPDSGLFATYPPAPFVPTVASATTIKILRTAVATATADVATKTTAVATAVANKATADALVVSTKAVLDGSPLEVIKAQWTAKYNAEVLVNSGLQTQWLLNQIVMTDPDSVVVWNDAIAATATALADTLTQAGLKATAVLDVAAAQLALTTAQGDTLVPYTAYYITLAWEHLNAGVSFAPAQWVTLANAPTYELLEQTAGIWNTIADRDEWTAAVAAQGTATTGPLGAITAARALVATKAADLATANTDLATATADLATAITTYEAKKAISDPYVARFAALTAIAAKLTAQIAGSNARLASIENLILWLTAYDSVPPVNPPAGYTEATYAANQAKWAAAVADAALKATAKTTADANLTAAKAALTAANTALADGLVSYKLQQPFDQQYIAFLTAQLADLNAEIDAQVIILAQKKSVVTMWLDKIKLALA